MMPRHKRRNKNKRLFGSLLVALALVAIFYLALPAPKTSAPGVLHKSAASGSVPAAEIKNSAPTAFDKAKYPLEKASSLWAVVNKGRRLPSSYVPAGLTQPAVASSGQELVRSEVAAALRDMFAAASKNGIRLEIVSGYRSYSYQQQVYGGYVSRDGVAAADTYSARPGFSEHQTGLAADLGALSGSCRLDQCFGDIPEGRWLAANSFNYGFIIRYPKGKDKLTGYEYEPWHVRYVGSDLAKQIHDSGQTLEQFFGLSTYSSYAPESLTLKQ